MCIDRLISLTQQNEILCYVLDTQKICLLIVNMNKDDINTDIDEQDNISCGRYWHTKRFIIHAIHHHTSVWL